MSLLSVKDLCRTMQGSVSVKDVSFTQQPLENIAIAGETGSGKTTLLKMIAGLIQPTSGAILVDEERIKGPDEQLIPGNKKVGYLSQHFELRNNYRVHEVLDMANRLAASEADKIYAICRIEHLLQRWTDELSGGEKQRIAFARLLSTSPQLLLLDEPFSNLDLRHKSLMKTVLAEACEYMNITCTLVSHDAPDILSWADTVLLFRDGKIVQRGPAKEVYNKPLDEYCAALLGAYNLVEMPGHVNKMFVRPETITLTWDKEQETNCEVKNVLFWGSYYTTDVIFRDQLVRVQSAEAKFSIGQHVFLSFAGNQPWYVQSGGVR